MEVTFIIPGFDSAKQIVLTVQADLETRSVRKNRKQQELWSDLVEASSLFAWAYKLDCRNMREAARVLRDEGRKSFCRFLEQDGDLAEHRWTVQSLSESEVSKMPFLH